ncbi:hypothetical protein AVEN_198811-1 [Araneus ventricosus]|uniref:G domain-containing protein n=1 Tax=Araneus ventricosus TaxID=182803 RepID=A0A4Y2KGQ4_ARAVE|nr:hypothetical protein AVEN_198811-1 [Araneus ventricosus]
MENEPQITNFIDNVLMNSTLSLLERGEHEIVLRDNYRHVVLILGNTGSGKSTFTQWIAGDNTKLIAKEVREDTGEYIIEDNNRIGNSTLKSKTVFPELVIDPKTSIAYYDCPGFDDSRSTSNELATTYFIKKVLDHAESIKMIFTVSYPSVRKGVDRQDFMKLLRHVTDLIRDIDKFESSFAMIVTKVDNQYIRKGNSFVLVEDAKVLDAIVDFLLEVQCYLDERTDLPEISDKERKLLENSSRFISKLLIKDSKQYSRIGIFRRPDQAGPLSNITLLQQGKEHVENILHEKLKFTEKADDDFGHTISERSKNNIKDLMEEVNQAMWSNLNEIAKSMRDYYKNLVEQIRTKIKSFNSYDVSMEVDVSEAQKFSAKLSNGYRITSDIVKQMKTVRDIGKVSRAVSEIISKLDINVRDDLLVYVSNQGNFFKFLQTVSGKEFSSRSWEDLYIPIITYISESKTIIQDDVINVSESIGDRIQSDLNSIAKVIQSDITGKRKLQEILKNYLKG